MPWSLQNVSSQLRWWYSTPVITWEDYIYIEITHLSNSFSTNVSFYTKHDALSGSTPPPLWLAAPISRSAQQKGNHQIYGMTDQTTVHVPVVLQEAETVDIVAGMQDQTLFSSELNKGYNDRSECEPIALYIQVWTVNVHWRFYHKHLPNIPQKQKRGFPS